ncbi:hypothetical protein GGI1_02490 [Acidithiobacillus sp. GGI-221]|nr:hypothetical protein GGI1_02490 [Acidithiobacillus sp. GGI-221]
MGEPLIIITVFQPISDGLNQTFIFNPFIEAIHSVQFDLARFLILNIVEAVSIKLLDVRFNLNVYFSKRERGVCLTFISNAAFGIDLHMDSVDGWVGLKKAMHINKESCGT